MNRPIALLTDFGLADSYVGVMKGVMMSICPSVYLIDITHNIAPQNVRQAAYVLLTSYAYFPSDTIFLIVVDPGVGTVREPIAVETDHGVFVAPDNGVLSYALNELDIHHSVILRNSEYWLSGVSRTFHGRDIFSPVAAHLANGISITDLGPALPKLVRLDDPRLDIETSQHTLQIHGEVLHIDHFGNVITSIGQLIWQNDTTLLLDPCFGKSTSHALRIIPDRCQVRIGVHSLSSIHSTYDTVSPGTLISLIGSSGQLEIGMNQGNAAQAIQTTLGDPVTIEVNQD